MTDLKYTWIPNVNGELKDLWLAMAKDQGFDLYSEGTLNSFSHLYITKSQREGVSCVMSCTIGCVDGLKEITLADLKPVKPKRVNVSYEFIEEFTFDLKQDFDAGCLYCGGDDYTILKIEDDVAYHLYEENLYRKIETEITWQSELDDFLSTAKYIDKKDKLALFIPKLRLREYEKNEFISLCHLVASMTDKPESEEV